MMRRFAIVAAFLVLLGSLAQAEEIVGRVSSVYDGDTIALQTDKGPLSVRLEGIDAPERSQEHGIESRDFLRDLVAEKRVTVIKTGTDKYGRTLGTVKLDGVDINAKMLESGWAWHFKKYSKDQTLANLESSSKKSKRGIWANDSPVAPWDYREAHSNTASKATSIATPKVKIPKAEPVVQAADPDPMPVASGGYRASNGKFKESESEKAYEKEKGVEVVHKKDGTTYERKARSKK